MSPGPHHSATFRFYAELEDFLRPSGASEVCRVRRYQFNGNPSVKDAIEAQGVPHPEVGLILLNGQPAGFDASLAPGDRVAVFPVFRSLELPGNATLRGSPPGDLRFVLDVNLGKLARWLRLLGFDALYRNDFRDAEVAAISANEERIALTRDRRLLHQKQIVHGYWVRSDDPNAQVIEVVRRFRLASGIRPIHRCLACNGLIRPVAKERVWDRLEPKTKIYYREFFQCDDCGKVYWKGSHYAGLLEKVRRAVADSSV